MIINNNPSFDFTKNNLLPGFGSVSDDSDVIVGRNGYLFLGDSSNRVKSLYSIQPGQVPQKWIDLFIYRANRLSVKDIPYVQLIIPEKSTVLHQLCPFSSEGGTPLLKSITDLVKKLLFLTFIFVLYILVLIFLVQSMPFSWATLISQPLGPKWL